MKNKKIFIIITCAVFVAGITTFFCLFPILTVSCKNEDGVIIYEQKYLRTFFDDSYDISYPDILGYQTAGSYTLSGSAAFHKKITISYETEKFNAPILKISTENNKKINSKDIYTKSTVSLVNCDDEYQMENVDAGIRLRGNSTAAAPKSPYRIKFDTKTNVLGLNGGSKFKNWVLLADWYDYSLSRNYINFYLGSNLNIYSSDYKVVEVFVNGRYSGVYLLCEQQEINKNRIDIEEYDEAKSDPTNTGYLLENDYYYYENEDFFIENNINGNAYNFTHWLVKGDTTSPAQLTYITNYMQSIYDELFNACDETRVSNLVDIDSAVEMTILQLINKDSDSNSSFYVYKDKNGKLVFAAPWDADMAYANLTNSKNPEGAQLNHLLSKLMTKDWFSIKVKARWQELTDGGLRQNMIAELNYLSATFTREYERNFKAYSILGKKNFDPHQVDEVTTFKNQKDASGYLINWLNARFDWLENSYFA
ncbi:MAG: CotH kinase family protein [Clostridiales bacterium]|jgi:hypothetical protein|nr:CotH kinase family protein [Clostridiales bacterium]